MNVFSYVVDHDEGRRPDPYFNVCTLCGCKCRTSRGKQRSIEELAKPGDWVIGTGGAGKRSTGHGKLIYAMRVDETPTRWEYFTDNRFKRKHREPPRSDFEKRDQFALVSRHFYYFGAGAIDIPERFTQFQKKGPGFRYVDPEDFRPFLEWLRKKWKPGMHGEPCGKVVDGLARRTMTCMSSC